VTPSPRPGIPRRTLIYDEGTKIAELGKLTGGHP
jgi:hypothetical protein